MLAIWVFVGGGSGALLRWVLTSFFPTPWGTALVNVIGCFVLAALMHPHSQLHGEWRLALGTGVLGGFTTYSTFNLELVELLIAGEWERAAAQVTVTLLGGVTAGFAGWTLAGWLRAA